MVERSGLYQLGEIQLQTVSREEVMTTLGAIVRSEIVFGGVPRIVYSAKLPDIGFEDYVKDVVSAEEAAIDPDVIQDLKNKKGKTPEQFIEDGSNKFIEDLRTSRYSPSLQTTESVLDPLVKQRANKKLFAEAKKAEAKKANRHKAKGF